MPEHTGRLLHNPVTTTLVFSLLLSGCATSRRAFTPAPRTFSRDQVVTVWTSQGSTSLREVSIKEDSVRGQTLQKVNGERPMVAFATSEVDSMRLVPRGSEPAEVVGIGFLAAAFWFIISHGHGN